MAVPAWKQAILEKKRKQEEEKKKKQEDKEAYIASLPPWKQAMVRKKLEIDQNATILPVAKHVNASIPSVSKPLSTTPSVQQPLNSNKSVSDMAKVFISHDKPSVDVTPLPEEPRQDAQSQMRNSKPCSDSEDGKETKHSRTPHTKPRMETSANLDIDETDPQVLAMPKWKQELLRRKKSREEQPRLPVSEKQADIEKQSETVTENLKQHKSDVVNSSNTNDSPKLIQKEGKSLKPPVFNMASKWANITEDDPQFKKLPSWKQAVIRRRKEDATKRTAPLESPVVDRKVAESSATIVTPWFPSNEVALTTETQNEGSSEMPHWKKKLKRASTSSPSLPIPKQEPLFASELHNKKAQKLLLRFSQPSDDSTSEPVNDSAGVTMIDEESDDDLPIPSSGRRESALRRVSFSDSDLTTEHIYPKYDYSDYHEIVQEETTDEVDGIATPIHPWLSTVKSPQQTSDPTSVTAQSLNNLNSLDNFMSAYTSNNYSNSSKVKEKDVTIEESKQSQFNGTYTSTDNDTAALMF